MMKTTVERFLQQVLAIERLKPTYKLGGDGSQGTCDCVGLIIGALKRCGVKWNGIHGSNWAARNEVLRLHAFGKDMRAGDVVFKTRPPGSSGYSLPTRYGSSQDRLDYYHIGVVYQVDPLIIIHCTGPGVIRDAKQGKWAWCAQLKAVEDMSATASAKEQTEQTAKPSAVNESRPSLRLNARGDAVREMQELLLDCGMALPRFGADGKFGNETLAALKAFQQKNAIVADGVCGAVTWAKLQKQGKEG